MGSISTVTDEQKLYDDIYDIARDVIIISIPDIRYKDTRAATTEVPVEYAYLSQVHDAYVKRTLAPGIYDVDVEFLCEINVSHANIEKGRRVSKEVQRAFHQKASACGLVVKGAMATDTETATGQRFVVAMTLLYTTKMV